MRCRSGGPYIVGLEPSTSKGPTAGQSQSIPGISQVPKPNSTSALGFQVLSYRWSPAGPKSLISPVITTKSAKSLKPAPKNPPQRRFVTAKKKNPVKKQDDAVSNSKNENQIEEEEEENSLANDETEPAEGAGSSTKVKRRRERVLEEARRSVPEGGCGKVMHLVKAFEELMSIPASKKKEETENNNNNSNEKAMKWALPGLQLRPSMAAHETEEVSSSSFCPSDLVLTFESLGLDPPISGSSSWDSNSHESTSSRNSTGGGRRSRRNSLESSGTCGGRRRRKKHPKAAGTSQKPFKLRTEERGKMKKEEFMKKIQEVMIEEEKQRIPIALGLPWTTDEPENLVKPAIKDITRPIDLKLHSDLRSMDRAEFDQQVAEKLSYIEQYKMERERQEKLAEEEEIRRLRKELVPKAQPMPYFDRPFIPRRSMKHPTIPREPKFQIAQAQNNKKDQALLIME
ncbi:Protein TPX2 [Senna tora]|uniref:Protein TPX2 n=1 Tax=Senna tora TaxID=362788 RepID=A0A834VYS3_9FABA|nr:Protein TPX2 [Senna tora]